MLGAAPWLGRFCLRWPGLVVFAVVIAFSALLSTLLGPQPHAQSQGTHPTDQWVADGGTVELDKTGPYTLTIREGETASYSMQLTKRPHNQDGQNDGWWVRIIVAGSNRIDGLYDADEDGVDDISWVPSVGWQFDLADWNGRQSDDPGPWRNVSITALEDPDNEDQTITISHELWDHNTYCPPALHGGGSLLAVLTVRIIDDDGDLPSLSIKDATANEGADVNFVVELNKASDETVTVSYATSNETAEAGTDYTAMSSTLTFEAGERTKTIPIPTRGDTIDEEDETFTVRLSGPSEATLQNATATGTITDDDGPPALSINNAEASEGSPAQFTVTLTPASGKTVTVDYATADGSAKDDSDYTTLSNTLTFMAGERSKPISVQTREDLIDEPDEMFTVSLSSLNGATLSKGTGTGTITDDDDPPTLSIEDTTVGEGNDAEFTVRLSRASGKIVTADYVTADVSALAGTDYTAANGTLTIPAGEPSTTLTVSTIMDNTADDGETFRVSLSDEMYATVQRRTATATIIDEVLPDAFHPGRVGC